PSPGLAERFVREARTSARLEHPHIVPIYKVGGYKNEVLYIVMRCLDGPSLRQLLEKHHHLSLRDAARIARQVADALGHAHLHGDSAQSILMKQATATPVPIQQHRSEIPPTLAGVVDRALAKDPAERFQTAEELSGALVDALPTAAQDSVRMRSPVLVGALQALLGLGVVGALVLVGLAVLSQPPRISARAPIPDSLAQPLRRQGALVPGDAALYVFSPRGADDTTLLLVARRNVAVVTPHRVRG